MAKAARLARVARRAVVNFIFFLIFYLGDVVSGCGEDLWGGAGWCGVRGGVVLGGFEAGFCPAATALGSLGRGGAFVLLCRQTCSRSG